MGLAACKAAFNSAALIGTDSCQRMMGSLEFVMATNDWSSLSEREQQEFVDRAGKLDKKLTRCCQEFCEKYAELMDDVDEALRPDRE